MRRSLFALALLSACTTVPPKEAETGPMVLLQDYLKVCQDPQALLGWLDSQASEELKKLAPIPTLIDDFGLSCEPLGGFQQLRVKESAPDRIVAVAQSVRIGLWHRIALSLDAAGKIRRGSSRSTFTPEDAIPKDRDEAAVITELQALVKKLTAADLFSGIAVIARGSEIIATSTGGFPDQKRRTAFTPDTQFTLGSMSKLFTTVAIGQLVDQGKLAYTDKVGRFFPRYGNQTVREQVTIDMLLSHRGGLGDFLEKRPPKMMRVGVKTAAEFVPLFENDALESAPGEKFFYSNAGLALAGAIVEKASGLSYPDYLRQHIFRPAGMQQSDPNNLFHIVPEMVVPYTIQDKKRVEAERDIGSPAGGGISTARDLVRFADAFRQGRLVKPQTYAAITTTRATPPMGEYGYAIIMNRLGDKRIVGHGGGFPGVSTELYMLENSPYTLVVLSNYDPDAAERVGGVIVPMLATARRE